MSGDKKFLVMLVWTWGFMFTIGFSIATTVNFDVLKNMEWYMKTILVFIYYVFWPVILGYAVGSK